MSNVKKLMMTAAGGGGLNVEDVFSVYTYQGNGTSNTTTQDIVNGIDLQNEGGMVWIKDRFTKDHFVFDTERGATKYIRTNNTDAESSPAEDDLSAFNDDGFTVRGDNNTNQNWSYNSQGDYASWTFRKAPKFFDVVTYTGDGSAQTNISHNLNADIGMIVIKRTDSTSNWFVWHRGNGSSDYTSLELNGTASAGQINPNYYDKFTSTTFRPTYVYDSGFANANINGASYVAYLFAHNDGDGGFGPDGDADIIKCGSYTGNGSTDGPEIDLGFEPQYILFKRTDANEDWFICDALRGISLTLPSLWGLETFTLKANTSNSEADNGIDIQLRRTGWKVVTTAGRQNANGGNYIYMAIRKGPMAIPEDATKVFDTNSGADGNNTTIISTSNGPIDLIINGLEQSNSNKFIWQERLGNYKPYFKTTSNAGWDQGFSLNKNMFSRSQGFQAGIFGSPTGIQWTWKRAPQFLEIMHYQGTGSNRTIDHSLGATPEMIWIKEILGGNCKVYTSATGAGNYLILNSSSASTADASNYTWNNTAPTETNFSLGIAGDANQNGRDYLAYLFCSLAGVSKIGSFTASNGLNVDCGFSSGARFVLLKRTDAGQGWYIVDTERGIVSGSDAVLTLNSTGAEFSSDLINPYSAGFSVGANLSGTYVFYAIA